jgi:CRISPR-associated protein Cmr4
MPNNNTTNATTPNNLYITHIYLLKPLTNLHAGSGEANFDVIDKKVQRDVLTGIPTVFASSLKGALREHVMHAVTQGHNSELAEATCRIVFGDERSHDNKSDQQSQTSTNPPKPVSTRARQGYLNFFDAKLLAIPVRSDTYPYLIATSKSLLEEYNRFRAIFGFDGVEIPDSVDVSKSQDDDTVTIEDQWTYKPKEEVSNLRNILGVSANIPIVVLEDKHLRQVLEELPVIARNQLDNGISNNLWYEEVVPRESIFYTAIQEPGRKLLAHYNDNANGKNKDKQVSERIETFFKALKNPFFLGANNSVGYGLCQLVEITTSEEEEEENA